MIGVGKLRNRVVIQVPIRVRNTQNSFDVFWAYLREVWCQIQPITAPSEFNGQWRGRVSGKENNFAAKTRALISHRITMRAQSEWMTPDMRLVEELYRKNNPNYRVFNIVEVQELENINMEMRIDVVENLSDIDDSTADYTVLYDDTGNTITDDAMEYVVV